MGFRAQNDRKRLAGLASAKTRDGSSAVWALKPTEGAVNSGRIPPLAPRKPDGLLRINRKNPISEFSRVKTASVYEFTS
jgi:hypothetical protein